MTHPNICNLENIYDFLYSIISLDDSYSLLTSRQFPKKNISSHILKKIEKAFEPLIKKFVNQEILYVRSEHTAWIKELLSIDLTNSDNMTSTTKSHLMGRIRIEGKYTKEPSGMCMVKHNFNGPDVLYFEMGNYECGEKNGVFLSIKIYKNQLLTPETKYSIDSHKNGMLICSSIITAERNINLEKYKSFDTDIKEDGKSKSGRLNVYYETLDEISFKYKRDKGDGYTVSFTMKNGVFNLSDISFLSAHKKYQTYSKISFSGTGQLIEFATNKSGKPLLKKYSSSTFSHIGTDAAKDIFFRFK